MLEADIRHRANWPAALVVAAVLGAAAVAPAFALAQGTPSNWVVKRDAFAELWYHGLATIGSERYGPLPLYSADHVRASRETKRRLGRVTRLDRSARTLRIAFTRDSAFEVLHFVPPYFIGEEPGDVLAALQTVLADVPAPRGISRSLVARAGAVARSLPSPAERATLQAFVDALWDEWDFVRLQRADWPPSTATLTGLQRGWDERFGTPLAGYLRAIGHERGVIVVVPAVGPEGRIVTTPSGATIIIVSADRYSGSADAPLLASVRELSFPLLAQVSQLRRPGSRDPAGDERAREVAAVRGGALLLEALAPALAEPYRMHFTLAGDGRGGRAFDTIYPLDAATDSALREVTLRLAMPGGSRQ